MRLRREFHRTRAPLHSSTVALLHHPTKVRLVDKSGTIAGAARTSEMSRFTVELLWPKDVINTVDERCRTLVSQELMPAKLEAALVYAEHFKGPPPAGYRLVQDDNLEVYRYPRASH